mmetsp:Transcript_20796/g.57806  ORF Transcript_20796/g.57806 Transcript_20796/m.57806 type:complete len:110 (-) Transcript_20796:597-926(-)|eukprot:CAMPEP_0198111222 /NCGR_PEP_ID=MMETSP1442-20131203/3194_1 /TAXON_ID= /ORGANISM="Craspedostauros australis, Strain CCMP3328" /LENGTH=109 /DNA_ID=CAMNT_0043767581 /DNA_START=133 /DNA_END=462 /DNA_ORIENTATION=+
MMSTAATPMNAPSSSSSSNDMTSRTASQASRPYSAPRPMATSGLTMKHAPQHAQWSHSPIIMAMITNNRLSNCNDVFAMVDECRHSRSNDRVCQTAADYFDMCMNSSHA